MHQHQGTHDRSNSAARLAQRGTRSLSRTNIISLMAVGLIGFACSSNDNPGSTGPGGIGGATGTTGGSGTGPGTGGASNATGGASSSTAGSQATGGAASSGGTSSNGSATGGTSAANTGGAATGGKSSTTTSATGGAATGGKSSTTTSITGGAATGGKSSTTTSATGGAETGGTSTAGGAETGGTTGAGGTAVGGTSAGGSSACSDATITKVSDSDYQLKMCDVTMHVNPKIGARISSLTVGTGTGTAVLVPLTCPTYDRQGSSCQNSAGATFWTSPQSAWPGGSWPPVTELDGGTYTVTDGGSSSGHLVLTGSADPNGASVVKDISADPATGWITVKYTINAAKAIQVAPWQVARVPRGGLVFFPATTAAIKSPGTTWTMTQAGGYDWIDDKNQSTVNSADGSKYVVDGAAVSGEAYTLLGYVLNKSLLLFRYENVAQSAFAPGEADTEVYPGSGTIDYIELEAQGPYTSLTAGTSLSWTIQWRVASIPNSVTVGSNSATLITFAEQQAAL